MENEKISFDYGPAQAKAHGNAKAVAELEAIAPYPGNTPITRERIITARTWPQYYGGLTAYRDDSKYYFGAASSHLTTRTRTAATSTRAACCRWGRCCRRC